MKILKCKMKDGKIGELDEYDTLSSSVRERLGWLTIFPDDIQREYFKYYNMSRSRVVNKKEFKQYLTRKNIKHNKDLFNYSFTRNHNYKFTACPPELSQYSQEFKRLRRTYGTPTVDPDSSYRYTGVVVDKYKKCHKTVPSDNYYLSLLHREQLVKELKKLDLL